MAEKDYIEDVPIKLELNSSKFKSFDIRLYKAIGDGNCFFHSVLMGFVSSYRQRVDKSGKDVSRRKFVIDLRRDIANLLEKPNKEGKTLYETLSRGKIKEFSSICPDYSLPAMQRKLRSSEPVGLEMIEATSIALDVNILLIDRDKGDVYHTGDDHFLFDESRQGSVVLLYKDGHFDLCGIGVNVDTSEGPKTRVVSYFLNSNPFIQHLRSLSKTSE